jgi:hypothetical protein
MSTNLNFAELVVEAEAPSTPPERLSELAQQVGYWSEYASVDGQVPVRKALARNPNTPPEILQPLAGIYPDDFLANPVAPLLTREMPDFLDPLRPDQLLALLLRPDAPPSLIAPLRTHANARVRETARLHVSLVAADDVVWEAEARRAYRRLPLVAGEALLELAELDLTPFWIIERFAGGLDRRLTERLLSTGDEPEQRALRELLRRAADDTAHALTDAELARLARSGVRARCLAAVHPDTPAEVLERLAGSGGPLARKWVARNSALPPALAAELASAAAWRVRVALARNPNTPPELLDQLAGDTMPPVRAAVARNAATPAGTLERLASDERVSICVAVARNRMTPAPVLEQLARSTKRSVRLGVRTNPAAPQEALELLAEEPARRPGERFPWLGDAWKRRKPKQASRAGQRDTSESYQKALAMLPPEVVLRQQQEREQVEQQKQTARDPGQPAEVLEPLAQHPLPTVRAALAENPAASPALLMRLARDSSIFVLNRVALHPHTPLKILIRLMPGLTGVTARALLRQRQLPPELLAALSQHGEETVRRELVRQAQLPAAVLEKLAGDRSRSVRTAVARRFDTPDYRERRMTAALKDAAASGEALARFLALAHPLVQPGVLEEFLGSPDWLNRLALTLNPAASEELLQRLAGDANQVVCKSALSRLAGEPPLVVDRLPAVSGGNEKTA